MPDKYDRGNRPSPRESATLFMPGYRREGQDGNMWVIVENVNGVKRWQRYEEGGVTAVDNDIEYDEEAYFAAIEIESKDEEDSDWVDPPYVKESYGTGFGNDGSEWSLTWSGDEHEESGDVQMHELLKPGDRASEFILSKEESKKRNQAYKEAIDKLVDGAKKYLAQEQEKLANYIKEHPNATEETDDDLKHRNWSVHNAETNLGMYESRYKYLEHQRAKGRFAKGGKVNVRTLLNKFDKEKPSIYLIAIADDVVMDFMKEKFDRTVVWDDLSDEEKQKYNKEFYGKKDEFAKYLMYEFVRKYYSNKDNLRERLSGQSRATINGIRGEMTRLAKDYDESKYAKGGITEWLGRDFESSSGTTPEFAQFAKDYKKALTKELEGYELVGWSRGHFDISAFFKNRSTGKLVYISTSDVRGGQDGWYNNILIRTAQHEKDYRGGSNNWTSFDRIKDDADRLTRAMATGGLAPTKYKGAPSDIWEKMNESQRFHFLRDHREDIYEYGITGGEEDDAIRNGYKETLQKYARMDYSNLPSAITSAFRNHTKGSRYSEGGIIGKLNQTYSFTDLFKY